MALIGPSGGGKTTLLRIVAGLETPSGGEVEVRKTDGTSATSRVMFQEDRLIPWRRVLDNVSLGLPKAELPRAQRYLGAVGLGDRQREWPVVLSGGQKQRVALARALAHRPDLLLLDEPFGALDALTRAGMQKLLEELWQREQPTVLLVTHDVEEALMLADRVIVLQDGQLATDLRVNLTRPRHRGDPWLATHKEELLDKLLVEELRTLMTATIKTLRAVGISGSPSANSRSRLLVAGTLDFLAERGVETSLVDLLDLPADALLARRFGDETVDRAIKQVDQAAIVVLGTPVYRATYAGQLKAFFDLFPQEALRGMVIGLIATGAGPGHALAIDHGLRPLVASLRGLSAATALYLTDKQIPDKTHFPPEVATQVEELALELYKLAQAL